MRSPQLGLSMTFLSDQGTGLTARVFGESIDGESIEQDQKPIRIQISPYIAKIVHFVQDVLIVAIASLRALAATNVPFRSKYGGIAF